MKKQKAEKPVLGKLDAIFNDPDVSELFVDGPDRIYFEKNGKIIDADFNLSARDVEKICTDVLASTVGGKFHKGINMFDVRLPDGSKFIGVLSNLSVKGPAIVITKIPSSPLSWKQLEEYKSLDRNARRIIEKILSSESSVLIAGNRGSGKTTIANCVANSIPESHRLVVVEKNLQMRISHPRSLVIEIPKDDFVEERYLNTLKYAPNLAPDWLVVSDITGRDGSEVINLMRSGVSCLATMHAEDVPDCLKRLEYMCLGANPGFGLGEMRGMIASGLKFILFQQRCEDKRRRLTKIVRVVDTDGEKFNLETLFFWNEETQSFALTVAGKNFAGGR